MKKQDGYELNKNQTLKKEEDMETDIIGENPSYDKKYQEALKASVKLDVQEFGKTQPEASAKDVLFAILKDYDRDIPSPILLEMAQIILADWTVIQENTEEVLM